LNDLTPSCHHARVLSSRYQDGRSIGNERTTTDLEAMNARPRAAPTIAERRGGFPVPSKTAGEDRRARTPARHIFLWDFCRDSPLPSLLVSCQDVEPSADSVVHVPLSWLRGRVASYASSDVGGSAAVRAVTDSGGPSSRVIGISFRHDRLDRLNVLAKAEGVSRSEMVGRLVDRAVDRTPAVTVDGRRFVPVKR
jgi:hypothetical protein